MIGLLFKGEIIKPAYASSVEYVCVLDRVFVVKGDSIAQLWTYSNNRGSKPKH